MNFIEGILLLILIVIMILFQIIMFIDHVRAYKEQKELTERMMLDVNLSIAQKIEKEEEKQSKKRNTRKSKEK